MLRNGPTMPAHPVAHDKIDLCEKWRLDRNVTAKRPFSQPGPQQRVFVGGVEVKATQRECGDTISHLVGPEGFEPPTKGL